MPKGCTRTLEHRPARSPPFVHRLYGDLWVKAGSLSAAVPVTKAQEAKTSAATTYQSDLLSLCCQILSTMANLFHIRYGSSIIKGDLAILHLISPLACINCSPHKITFRNGYQRNKCICKPFCPMRFHIHLPAEHAASVAGTWRCCDCFPESPDVHQLCRDNHASNPFHRIDHGTGSFFEPAWLFQVGVILHLGHDGNPVLATLNSSPSGGLCP